MWANVLRLVLKYLGVPLLQYLLGAVYNFLKKWLRDKFKKEMNEKIDEALELSNSDDNAEKLEGAKKFEENFNDFK